MKCLQNPELKRTKIGKNNEVFCYHLLIKRVSVWMFVYPDQNAENCNTKKKKKITII